MEFMTQALLIRRLEESRAEHPVNFDRSANYALGELFMKKTLRASVSPW
jgi:hypothetical protein